MNRWAHVVNLSSPYERRSGESARGLRSSGAARGVPGAASPHRARVADAGPAFVRKFQDARRRGDEDVTFIDANCDPPESFTYGSWGSICSPDYAPFFDAAVSVIDTACSQFEPPG